MTEKYETSPSPSEVGFSLVSRRTLLASAAATAAGAALVAGAAHATSGTTAATTAASGGGDLGEVTFGSNYSGDKPKAAMEATIAATGLNVKINTVDNNTYQENFNTYVQQPDDVFCWFAGYRMRAFAKKGVLGDLSDIWATKTDAAASFKDASTADGKQYLMPMYFYPWAVMYRESLWKEKGYAVPAKWDDLLALCEKMKADGITPFAAVNDGKWPQMGTFDAINCRMNGYQFHVDLMAGKESWTGDKVKAVFENWKKLLPYYQEGVNSNQVSDGATAIADKSHGMILIGTFLTENFDPTKDPEAQAIIDDISFFPFPEMNAEFGQDTVEAPIDGFLMAPKPKNEAGAKALVTALGGVAAITAYLDVNPGNIAVNSGYDTSKYSKLSKMSIELVSNAKHITQFLDRDTDPDFAAKVMGQALADFIDAPDTIDKILEDVEAKAKTYTFE